MGLMAGRSEKPTDRTSKQETKGERGRARESEAGRRESKIGGRGSVCVG